MMMRIALLVSLMALASTGYAQHSFTFKTIASDKDSAFIRKNSSYASIVSDTFSARRQALKILSDLYAKGYLFADMDSLKRDSTKITAYFTIGKQLQWIKLKAAKIDPLLLAHVGFKEKFYDGKIYNAKQIAQLDETVIHYCEDNGYPFASVKFDSINITGDSISARLLVSRNKLIFIDSFNIVGDVKISRAYLYNYFDIKPGSPYDESKIRAIAQKIKELPFLSEQKPYTVLFNDDKATVNLFLKNKVSSKLDFLIGFAPNSGLSNNLVITGQGDLYLNNAIGHGEVLNINFNKYPSGTTQLTAAFNYPYILSQPVGIDLGLDIYKQDTTYLNVNTSVGVRYLLTGSNYIKAFYNVQSSSLLSIDTPLIISSKQLPPNLDVTTDYYGLEILYEKLNYRFNPSNGFTVNASAAVGERQVKENGRIINLHDPGDSSFNFASLYDTVKLRTTTYKVIGQLYKYFSIKSRSVIKTGVSGAAIISQQALIYPNELFRTGGFNSIRGFDENSIYASQYAVFTLEYRYLLGQNSYFNIFNDDAYVENKSVGTNSVDYLFGIGTGIAFETKAGIFALSYAVGKTEAASFQLRVAKIHFGYVNYF